MHGKEEIEHGEGVEKPDTAPDERAAQGFIWEPLWQFPGGETFNEILHDRGKKPIRVALDEHKTGKPEAVVKGQRETQ